MIIDINRVVSPIVITQQYIGKNIEVPQENLKESDEIKQKFLNEFERAYEDYENAFKKYLSWRVNNPDWGEVVKLLSYTSTEYNKILKKILPITAAEERNNIRIHVENRVYSK